jgi:hypothetical protein
MDAKKLQSKARHSYGVKKGLALFKESEEYKQWHSKLNDRNKNKTTEWLNNISRSITEKQNKPEYKEHMRKQRLSAMDELVGDGKQTLREKITESNRISAKNPVHHANRTAANRRLKSDPNWKEAHTKGCQDSYGVPIVTPIGEYSCGVEFGRQNALPEHTGMNLTKTLPHLFYKKDVGPGEPVYERIYNTPYGKCATANIAYDIAKTNQNLDAVKLKNKEGWWLKMVTLYPTEFFLTFEVAKYWPIKNTKLIGIEDLAFKPRLTKEKCNDLKARWEKRLIQLRTLYKS